MTQVVGEIIVHVRESPELFFLQLLVGTLGMHFKYFILIFPKLCICFKLYVFISSVVKGNETLHGLYPFKMYV